MSWFPRTWVDIDLGALKHNLALLRRAIAADGGDPLLALVAKADAYGHGLVAVSNFAVHHGVDMVAVATVEEAAQLRESGVDAPILVISPILPIEAEAAIFFGLKVLVEREETARALSDMAGKMRTTAQVHLEVDTGLARFGVMPDGATEMAKRVATLPNLKLEGLSTHFISSSADRAGTETQIQILERVEAECAAIGIRFDLVHMANSAGAVRFAESRRSLVRIGIAAYGIDPYSLFPGESRPVMTWHARVMALREVPAGATISYSGTYRTERRTRVATLGVGYGDGYPRAMSNKGFVVLGGKRIPILGLVCMDQVLVDATDIEIELGDVAELVGANISVPEVAEIAGTNPHEITCRVMPRVPRHPLYPTVKKS